MEKKTVLVVEDSKMFARVLKERIEEKLGFNVVNAASMEETKTLLEAGAAPYFLALLDLNLPDAPKGEVVDYVVGEMKVPGIVFTGEFNEDMREDILAKGVIDYTLKESASSIDYVVGLIGRLHRNVSTKVLVVDDSKSARGSICKLLRLHMYQVLEAESGREALEVIAANPDIRLSLCDYSMPEMDGFTLIKKIRARIDKDDMAIIGVSDHGNNVLSAKFLKNGANDFISKPFLSEEFFCRISQNIENIENVRALKEVAIRDFLTGLYNRRYFFEAGKQLLSSAKREQITLTTVMLDIDHFKQVNDTYGHDAGDVVLKAVARVLTDFFRDTDLVSRFGGEEFCILCVNLDREKLEGLFSQLRQFIEDEVITAGEHTIRVTASIGVYPEVDVSLDEMVAQADKMLYRAKNVGRNRVVYYSDESPAGRVVV